MHYSPATCSIRSEQQGKGRGEKTSALQRPASTSRITVWPQQQKEAISPSPSLPPSLIFILSFQDLQNHRSDICLWKVLLPLSTLESGGQELTAMVQPHRGLPSTGENTAVTPGGVAAVHFDSRTKFSGSFKKYQFLCRLFDTFIYLSQALHRGDFVKSQ